MIEHNEIRELAQLMKELELTALEYTGIGMSIKLERAAGVIYTEAPPPAISVPVQQEETITEPVAVELATVKSPTVGVFYRAETPGKDPFVSVGDTVRTGDVLCLIDAMKMMNEITAECGGVIAEICVEDKQVVEFNQPLFRINPH